MRPSPYYGSPWAEARNDQRPKPYLNLFAFFIFCLVFYGAGGILLTVGAKILFFFSRYMHV